MTDFTYHGRRFHSLQNSESGEVGSGTTFHYSQDGDLVWATYTGGEIRHGTLVALADREGGLDMRYHHLNLHGELKTGICKSRPEMLPDGRLRLHEDWRWTSGDGSQGTSVLEELPVEAARPDTTAEVETEARRIVRLLQSTFDGEAWHGPSLWTLVTDLTAEQAAAPPSAGAHTIWELVGHVAGWLDVVYQRVSGHYVIGPEKNFPSTHTPETRSWSSCLAALRLAQEVLCSAILDLTEDQLSAVDPRSDFTLYAVLHGVVHHNLYHAGQVAILRRSLGITL